jgi:hypothetical protein
MTRAKPTAEMVQLIYERIDFVNHGDDGIREGLTDVFAIVERDYRVEPLCLEESGVLGVRCAKLRDHVGVHHAALPLGSGMTW